MPRLMIPSRFAIALLVAIVSMTRQKTFFADEIAFFSDSSNKTKDPAIYSLNFQQIKSEELLRFVSQIGGFNLIFDEQDLDFAVTIVSDTPTTLNSILAMVSQLLEIHNLSLIQDGKNLIIHKNSAIRQIPPVVTGDEKNESLPLMQTHLFKIQYSSPELIAALITPMLSSSAMVKVDSFSRYLIVTDLAANVEEVALLLKHLDRPKGTFFAYTPKHVSSDWLEKMAGRVATELFGGGALTMISDPASGRLFLIFDEEKRSEVMALINDLDSITASKELASGSSLLPNNVLIYRLRHTSMPLVQKTLSQIITSAELQGFASFGLMSMLEGATFLPSIHALMVIGSPELLAKVSGLLQAIDVPLAEGGKTPFLLYEPKFVSSQKLSDALKEIKGSLEKRGVGNQALMETIASMHPIEGSGGLLFNGDSESISELKVLIDSIDTPSKNREAAEPVYFIYKIQKVDFVEIQKGLDHFAKSLKEGGDGGSLRRAIETMEYIPQTGSILFHAENQEAADKLEKLVPSFDVDGGGFTSGASEFYMYTPRAYSPDELLEGIHSLVKKLEASGLRDTPFLRTLKSANYDTTLHVVVFTGDAKSIEQVKKTLASIDSSTNSSEVLLFHPQNLSAKLLLSRVHKIAVDIEKDPRESALSPIFAAASLAPGEHAILVHAPKEKMAEVQEILKSLDSRSGPADQANFFVYSIKNGNPERILSDLNELAVSSGDEELSSIASHAKYISSTNSIVFNSKDPQALARLKTLVTSLDNSEEAFDKVGKSNFVVYKLKIIDHDRAIAHLKEIGADSGDEEFETTVSRARYIPSTNSLVFTSTNPAILKKIQDLLASLDSPAAGSESSPNKESHFLVYRLESVEEKSALNYLSQLAADTQDNELKKSISSAKYIEMTHSLVFTSGDPKTLEKIHMLLTQIDMKKMKEAALTYKVYTPKNESAAQLISRVEGLAVHLSQQGVISQEELKTIQGLSAIGNDVLVSGTDSSIKSVMDLLARFDEQASPASAKSSISTLDSVSFLIYKVQYHLGSDILASMSDLAPDLASNPASASLASAIASLRWIQVTNSLIATGDPKTLAKLHELITSIDAPLRQIFIEVLALESTVEDVLQFGLRWGAQGNYRDRFALATANTQAGDLSTFATQLQKASKTNLPTGSTNGGVSAATVPILTGGSLGVIGDIILHGGQTYFALGPLVNAIKSDGNVSVTLNQKIITQDNRTSRLFVGDNIPFTGSIVTTAGLTNTTNANLEYRDIGISLSITPRVGENDIISLDIQQEISEEATTGNEQDQTVSTTQVNGIRTTKTEMNTRVHVPDRCFFIMSGSIRSTVTRTKTSIPCLGGLPVIGALFSQNDRLIEKRNIVIFVRPYIIRDYDMYRELTDSQECLFREKSATIADFDDGIDIVRGDD